MSRGATEANALTAKLLAALQAAAPGPPTLASAQLNYLCGVLSASALALLDVPDDQVQDSDYWPQLAGIFEQTRIAGATYETFDTIRVLITRYQPLTNYGAAISNFAHRLTLAEQAQCLAALTFASRDQIDAYLDLLEVSFSVAIEVAADNMDSTVYKSLLALQSAVVNDLSTRALTLPEIIIVTLPRSQPSLVIAQRLYQDPTEADALVRMNSVPHPLFMPISLRVLNAPGS